MSLFTSVVLVAIVLSWRALFFAMSLLFILLKEISTLLFCVDGFIAILLLPLILIEQLYRDITITINTDWVAPFFFRIFFCMVADLLAGRISGTGVCFLDVMISSRRWFLTFNSSRRNFISFWNELIWSFKPSINNWLHPFAFATSENLTKYFLFKYLISASSNFWST